MQKTTSRFSVRFLVPTIAAALVTTIAVALSVSGSVQRIDADSMERERELLARATAELVNQIGYSQESLGISDDAVAAYKSGDLTWLWDYMVLADYQTYGHSRAMIVGPNLEPVLAVEDGEEVLAASLAPEIARIAPLVEHIRHPDGQARISAYNKGLTTEIPSKIELMIFDGQPAYVGVMPILPNGDGPGFTARTQPYLVIVDNLDQDMADYLSDQYLLGDIAFSPQPLSGSEWAAMPMRASDGTIVTYLNWQPLYPGALLVTETLPPLLIGLMIAAIIVGLLLRNLRLALNHLKLERQEAIHRATHDPLTGLGNRRLFQSRLTEAFEKRAAGSTLAMLALDLDRFKEVNDTLGHDAGDALLIEVGKRMQDLLPADATLARLGGDEFAIVLNAHIEDATNIAGRIIAALGRPFDLSGNTALIGASIGLALVPDHAETTDALQSLADEALYCAKRSGRNRYCVYTRSPGASKTGREPESIKALPPPFGPELIARPA